MCFGHSLLAESSLLVKFIVFIKFIYLYSDGAYSPFWTFYFWNSTSIIHYSFPDDGENKKEDTEKSDNTNTNAISINEGDHKTEVTGLVTQKQNNTEAQTELRQRGTVKIQRNIESPRPERPTNDAATHIKTTEKSETDLNFTLKQIEGLKIGSLMLLAVICRLILNCGFGLFYFQVIIM